MAFSGARCKVQVTLPMTSGIAGDQVTNTWYISNDGNVAFDETNQTALDNAFKAFYKDFMGGASVACDATKVGLKYIDMDGAKPQYPFHTATLDCTATFPSTTGGPSEVAICLSYHAPYESGIRHARRNGRVFLGPLAANNVATQRPTHAAASAYITSANTLRDAIAAVSPSYMLAQHSTKDTLLHGPLTFWVDDAYDIQRRRGVKPSVKWLS